MKPATNYDLAKELEAIAAIPKRHPTTYEIVYQDLFAKQCVKTRSGARGMSAEQVLRSVIFMELFGLTDKEQIIPHIDSRTLHLFCPFVLALYEFKNPVLNKNIKALSADTRKQKTGSFWAKPLPGKPKKLGKFS